MQSTRLREEHVGMSIGTGWSAFAHFIVSRLGIGGGGPTGIMRLKLLIIERHTTILFFLVLFIVVWPRDELPPSRGGNIVLGAYC